MRTRKTRTELPEQLSPEELRKRAIDKALYILEHSDKSEAELFRKLKLTGYPDETAQQAVDYVKAYNYLDDSRYALNYVRVHASVLSRRELSNKLLQKGISRDDIDAAYTTYEEEKQEEISRGFISDDDSGLLTTEEQAAVHALRKKLNGKTMLDAASKTKAAAFLYRKGFGRDAVRRAFEVLDISIDIEAF